MNFLPIYGFTGEKKTSILAVLETISDWLYVTIVIRNFVNVIKNLTEISFLLRIEKLNWKILKLTQTLMISLKIWNNSQMMIISKILPFIMFKKLIKYLKRMLMRVK